jgi:serine/threonine protein kinase
LNHETKSSSRNNKIHQNNEKPKKLATSPSSTLIIDHLMIPYDRLNDLTKLGRGEFGEVLSASIADSDLPSSLKKLQHVNENGGGKMDENEIQLQQQRVKVLIKSMSRIKDDSYFVEFRRQIDLFRAVDSPNVVKLLAISFEKDHHFMILEHHRDFKGFLLEQQPSNITLHQLIAFSKQVVMGLDAISKSKLTHR